MDATTENILEQHLENQIREYAERAMQPLINAWGEQIKALVETELVKVRTDVTSATGDFATHDEVAGVGSRIGAMVTDKLLERVGERFDAETTAREKWQHAREQWQEDFSKQYEARLKAVETRAALAHTENADRITRVEAAHNERLSSLETSVKEVRSTQAAHVRGMEQIRADTAKTAANAEKMSTAFVEYLDQDKKRRADIDRDLTALKDSNAQTETELRQIQADIREQQKRVLEAEAKMQPVYAVAGALWRLWDTRRGNIVLVGVLVLFFFFQLLFAFLAYQTIVRP